MRFPFASTCVVFAKSGYSLVWVRFLSHVSPRFTYNRNNIPPRARSVRASCRLDFPPRLFFKVQCINEFPPNPSRRSLFSFFLRALHFIRHGLQCIWLILALCDIPVAISTVSRLASPARWSRRGAPSLVTPCWIV